MTDPTQSAGPARTRARSRQQPAERPPQDTSLLDLLDGTATETDEGRRRRDDGMRAAEHATHPAWKVHAERVVRELAATGGGGP